MFSIFLIAYSYYRFPWQTTKPLFTRFSERLLDFDRDINRISIGALQTEIRIYEPLYVYNNIIEKPFMNILFGSKNRAIMDVNHYGAYYRDREIHNEYATMVLKLGIVGLFFYFLMLFFQFHLVIFLNLQQK